MRPLIGIVCSWQEDNGCHTLADQYIQAITAAGGLPFIIPGRLPAEQASEITEHIDGLVLSGGPDLDPCHFSEEPCLRLGSIAPERDHLELALSSLFLQNLKPLLAICRGMQVLNVAAGGSLYQDLQGVTEIQHYQKAPRWYPTHEIELLEEGRLFRLVNLKSCRVNSFHHQAVNRLGTGLKATAWSRDLLIEAFEAEDRKRWILGVQWHPESNWNKEQFSFKIFSELIEQAQIFRNL